MAGSVDDAHDEQLVFPAGLLQGFIALGIPNDGVVSVLQEVGIGFVDEVVGGHENINQRDQEN